MRRLGMEGLVSSKPCPRPPSGASAPPVSPQKVCRCGAGTG